MLEEIYEKTSWKLEKMVATVSKTISNKNQTNKTWLS